MLGKKRGKLEQNLNNASQQLKSVLNDKNVSKLIQEIRGKVDRLDELLEGMEEASLDDITSLRELSKAIYKIASKYE